MVVKNRSLAIVKTDSKRNHIPKKESEFVATNYKKLEKNAKAMSILHQAIGAPL